MFFYLRGNCEGVLVEGFFGFGASHVYRLRSGFRQPFAVDARKNVPHSLRSQEAQGWARKKPDTKRGEPQDKSKGRPFMARTAVIPVRLTPDERDQLREKAREHKISLSDYIRRTVLSKKLPAKAAPEVNRQTYQELARVGNNLNQLVRAVHSGKLYSGGLEIFEALRESVKAIGLQCLGVNPDDC